jgi:hypothetical protein
MIGSRRYHTPLFTRLPPTFCRLRVLLRELMRIVSRPTTMPNTRLNRRGVSSDSAYRLSSDSGRQTEEPKRRRDIDCDGESESSQRRHSARGADDDESGDQ